MPARKLAITAQQRLGKRIDRLEATLKGQGTRLDAVEQRVQNLSQEVSKSLHIGNYEAMYRLEREENIKLRQALGQPGIEQSILTHWIDELDKLVIKLNPAKTRVTLDDGPSTPAERILIEKFGIELAEGVRDGKKGKLPKS